MILRRIDGKCSYSFTTKLLPRPMLEDEMVRKTKEKEAEDYAEMTYQMNLMTGGVCIYFVSKGDKPRAVTCTFKKLENFRIKGLPDDATQAEFIVSPGCSNVCFLERKVEHEGCSYDIGFSAIQCEEREGPNELILTWLESVFPGMETVSKDEAWNFIRDNITADQGSFDELWSGD